MPRDYTPLAVPYVESAAVIVAASSPWRTAREFVEEFRKRELRGSGGPHFGVWKFALAGLLDAVGINPSQLDWTETLSGEQGLENVLAGRADVAPITLTDARALLLSGQARALVTMEDARHVRFPAVPTVGEALDVKWQVAHWRGLVAPRGLPTPLRRDSSRPCARGGRRRLPARGGGERFHGSLAVRRRLRTLHGKRTTGSSAMS